MTDASSGIDTSTLLSIVGAIGTAGAGTIIALWKFIQTNMQKTESRIAGKLDECEAKHEESTAKLLELTREVGELGGKMEGYNQARDDLKSLSDEVLKIIKHD